MGYVILVRNPVNGKVFPITDDGDTDSPAVAEWKTRAMAEENAARIKVTRAWHYIVVEAPK